MPVSISRVNAILRFTIGPVVGSGSTVDEAIQNQFMMVSLSQGVRISIGRSRITSTSNGVREGCWYFEGNDQVGSPVFWTVT